MPIRHQTTLPRTVWLAAIQDTYLVVYGKDKTKEVGKYMNVRCKEGGVWKIYANHLEHERTGGTRGVVGVYQRRAA